MDGGSLWYFSLFKMLCLPKLSILYDHLGNVVPMFSTLGSQARPFFIESCSHTHKTIDSLNYSFSTKKTLPFSKSLNKSPFYVSYRKHVCVLVVSLLICPVVTFGFLFKRTIVWRMNQEITSNPLMIYVLVILY